MTGSRRVLLEHSYYQGETVLGVQRLDSNAWDFWLDRTHGIAYARLTMLGHTTPAELQAVLDRLAGDKLRGLILDLRWCPGGYFNESVQVAQLLLPRDRIVATVPKRVAAGGIHGRGGTAAPWVSRACAGQRRDFRAAEMVAAAIQDHKGAA